MLGGLTVLYGLDPGWVIGHFLLSMALLVAAVTLSWRATFEPGERPRSSDRLMTWSVRGLLVPGALTLSLGTIATDHTKSLASQGESLQAALTGGYHLAYVVAAGAAVGQQVRAGAAGFFQGVGQDRQVGETTLGVNGLRHGGNGGRPPGGIEGDGAEGVAELDKL